MESALEIAVAYGSFVAGTFVVGMGAWWARQIDQDERAARWKKALANVVAHAVTAAFFLALAAGLAWLLHSFMTAKPSSPHPDSNEPTYGVPSGR